jgi:hypothetical protein
MQSDFSAFGSAAETFSGDADAGDVTPGDVSAIQTDAASIQADAQAIEANPAPSCVPGMRPALASAATDYQKAAIDASNAMDQYSAGAYQSGLDELKDAVNESGVGDDEISDATTAAENFDS